MENRAKEIKKEIEKLNAELQKIKNEEKGHDQNDIKQYLGKKLGSCRKVNKIASEYTDFLNILEEHFNNMDIEYYGTVIYRDNGFDKLEMQVKINGVKVEALFEVESYAHFTGFEIIDD